MSNDVSPASSSPLIQDFVLRPDPDQIGLVTYSNRVFHLPSQPELYGAPYEETIVFDVC
jgi:hypothetical protein